MTKFTWLPYVLILTMMAVFSSCSNGNASAASPQQVAAQTKDVVLDMKEEEQDVFQALQDNLNRVNQLKEKLHSTDDPSTQLNSVVDELEKVTSSFEDLARRKDSVRKYLYKKVGKLQDLTEQAQVEANRLGQKRAELQQQLRELSDSDPEVAKVKRSSLEQAERYVNRQIDIWNRFIGSQKALEPQVQMINDRVDKFLAVIDGSALVYREAVNLLRLQRDIQEAFTVLTREVPEIERLSNEMSQSWDTLDRLVQALLTSAQPSP